MKLENQVVSLDLAKKLKEFGVKQDSLFYWRLEYHTSESFDNGKSLGKEGIFSGEYELEYLPKPRFTTANVKWDQSDLDKINETEISAFTSAELGELLPKAYMSFKNSIGDWYSEDLNEFIEPEYRSVIDTAKTEANARAKCLIYLLENNLIINN